MSKSIVPESPFDFLFVILHFLGWNPVEIKLDKSQKLSQRP